VFPADEVSLLIEEVVDRGEFLECFHPPKSQHGPLSSSEGEVGILDAVVQPPAGLLAIGGADLLEGGAVRAQGCCQSNGNLSPAGRS